MAVLQPRLSVQPNNIPHELCDRELTAAVELLRAENSDLGARLTILERER